MLSSQKFSFRFFFWKSCTLSFLWLICRFKLSYFHVEEPEGPADWFWSSFLNLFFGRFLYFGDFRGNKEVVFNFEWIWVPLKSPYLYGSLALCWFRQRVFQWASMQNCVTTKGDVIEWLINQQVFVLRNKALNFIFWSNNFFNTTLSCTVSWTNSLDWTKSLAAQSRFVKLHNICVFKYPNEARGLIVMIWFFVSGASSQVKSLHPLLLTFHFEASTFEKSTKLAHF